MPSRLPGIVSSRLIPVGDFTADLDADGFGGGVEGDVEGVVDAGLKVD